MHTITVRIARALCCLAVAAAFVAPAATNAADNPALWKHETKGDFATVLKNVKSGLEAAQFLITDEEDLAKGLENNKHILGGDKRWNTVGFQRATAVHFCSLVFNHEVFNIDMDWSVLCPFKAVLYTMQSAPRTVHIVTVRPTYLLKDDRNKRAAEIGKRVEERIVNAIKSGATLEIPK